MTIYKGEQFILPLKITRGNEVVTPGNIDDVRVLIGDYLKEYSKGEITFNNATLEWNYPLTQEMTVGLKNLTVPLQVGIKDNNEILYTETSFITLGESCIKEVWE